VARARKARDDYMEAHGRRRGRPQHLTPPTINVVSENNERSQLMENVPIDK